MRLTANQISTIKRHTRAVFGADAVVRLFGSRTDETLKGGDIDLFIEAPDKTDLPRRGRQLISRLQLELGDQKIDVVTAHDPMRPIEQQARATGIRL